MTKKKVKDGPLKSAQDFKVFLLPDYFLVCKEVILGAGTEISYIKTIETLEGQVPFSPKSFKVIASFWSVIRNDDPVFIANDPQIRLSLIKPLDSQKDGEKIDLGTYSVCNNRDGGFIQRLILEIDDGITFKEEGVYALVFEGRVKDGDFSSLGYKLVMIKSEE